MKGWGWPDDQKKAHFFDGGKSYCGRVKFSGDLEKGNDFSPDNCRPCMKGILNRKWKRSRNGPLKVTIGDLTNQQAEDVLSALSIAHREHKTQSPQFASSCKAIAKKFWKAVRK